MMSREEVINIIRECLRDVADVKEFSEEMSLIGSNSELDSIDFVTLMVFIEKALHKKNITVELVSERAMSQHRSPFRDVRSLADFIMEMI